MSALLTTIIQAVLGSIVNGILSYLKERRQERALQDAAKKEVENEMALEAIRSQSKMDGIKRSGRADVIDSLRNGEF